MRRTAALALWLLLAGLPARAETALPDPAAEARAQTLFRQVRCVACTVGSLADSPAELAADLRGAIREQVAAGAPDTEVLGWVEARYGRSALLTPPLEPQTWPLWFAPLAVVLVAGLILGRLALRGRKRRAGA